MAVKCILTGQTPSVLDGVTENVQTQLNGKVDKVTGKGLSTNDYTSAEKTKLSGIETGAQKNTITGVKGSAETTYRTGNVNITATNIGLGNVNNTSDAEKPISTATKTALDGKQEKVTGAATTITDSNLTADRALISNSSGKVAVSSVTSTELGYLDGVTSNIQTQLNNKLSSAPVTSVNNKTGAVTLAASDVGALPSNTHIPSTVAEMSDAGNYALKSDKVSKSGDTMTGKLTVPQVETGAGNSNFFQCRKFRGEGDANTYYHAIDFGYQNHDRVDFHEYGGIWNFFKNTSGKAGEGSLCGKITTNGWEGNAKLTGSPTAPTPGTSDNSTRIATTAFVNSFNSTKLESNGDGSSVTAAFTAASSRTNIATGEKLSVLFGKIAKWLSDLGSLAFKSTVAKTDLASDVQTSLGKADSALQSAPVTSVNNKTGAVTLAKGDVGLGNVDNTSDANKPISNATQAALNDKQSKITANGILKGDGKGNITAADSIDLPTDHVSNISLPTASWKGSDPYTQTVTISGSTANTKVDIQPSEEIYDQLVVDKVGYLAINNVNGTLTAVAKGNKPSVNLNIQVTYNNVYQ